MLDDVIWISRSVFLLSAFVVVYPYLVYPLALYALSGLRKRCWRRQDVEPSVAVIVAAHNEERIIEAKLRNCLALDYPADRLEICVVSDGSIDRTDAIVAEFAPRVRLVRLEPRGGKQAALNHAVAHTSGDIILFTDASVWTRPDLVRRVVRSFAEPDVGAVSTTIRIVRRQGDEGFPTLTEHSDAAAVGEAEAAYLDVDLKIRRLESFTGSAVGCCGSCYAVRRKCFVPFDHGACNDFASALDAVNLGFRVVFDDEAVGYMLAAKSDKGEYRRKLRTIAGGIDTLWNAKVWRRPWERPIFCWELLSHKVLRWLGPPALLLGWFAAIVGGLMGDYWLGWIGSAGAGVVLFACVGIVAPALARRLFPLRLLRFALISLVAGIGAWIAFFQGRRQITWQPTQR